MLASILTTFCFALSAVTAARASGLLGPSLANLSRLLIAAFLLGTYALIFGQGWAGPGLVWFQRIGPGVAVALLMVALVSWRRRRGDKPPAPQLSRDQRRTAASYTLANALAGPVLGVGFYQWALSSAPSGLVLAVVAATPIAVMPLSWFLEKDRPHASGVIGAFVAVGAVAGLVWLRS